MTGGYLQNFFQGGQILIPSWVELNLTNMTDDTVVNTMNCTKIYGMF